jgi:hypothetical protein
MGASERDALDRDLQEPLLLILKKYHAEAKHILRKRD